MPERASLYLTESVIETLNQFDNISKQCPSHSFDRFKGMFSWHDNLLSWDNVAAGQLYCLGEAHHHLIILH